MSHTVTLPQALFRKLEKLSASSKSTPETIVEQAVQDRLDYETWKSKKIREGLADIKAGNVISHEDMIARVARKMDKGNARKKAA